MLRGLLWTCAALCALAQDTGVVTGTVVDDQNKPVGGIEVQLSPRGRATGVEQLVTSSNQAGEFRFDVVKPASYFFNIPARGNFQMDLTRAETGGSLLFDLRAGDTVQKNLFIYPSGGVITGTVRDLAGDPVQGAQVQLVQRTVVDRRGAYTVGSSATTDDRGVYRIYRSTGMRPGRAYIRVSSFRPNSSSFFLPTYYGNTTERSRARALDITPGVELEGIDVQLSPTKAYAIRGRILDRATGQPFLESLSVSLTEGSDTLTQSELVLTRSGGNFTFNNLPPGDYIVSIVNSKDVRGLLAVTLGNADQAVDLLVSRGKKFAGTIRMADGPASASITLDSASRVFGGGFHRATGGAAEDGSVEIAGVYPVPYYLNAGSGNVYIKSFNGEPVDPSRPILLDFAKDSDHRAELVLSTHTAAVTGRVPTSSVLALWPASMSPWNPMAIRPARPKTDGTFSIEGLAPGKYHMAAWDFHPEIDTLILDPAFIAQFKASSVELGEDARATIAMELFPKESVSNAMEKLR